MQEGLILWFLKGIAIGGLLVTFISFAFPQFFKKDNIVDHNSKSPQSNIKDPTFSSAVKSHYNRLLLQVLNLVKIVNPDFSAAIYMIDIENDGFTCQEKTLSDFSDFIENKNKIISAIVKTSNPSIFKKTKKNEGWENILGTKTWRGSESLLGFPILYSGNVVGFLLVYMDHFSLI